MRRAYLALGLCGGIVGLGMHVDLLVHSLGHAEGAGPSWSSPAIGVALSVLAMLATLLMRTFRQPGAVLLAALAVLGLFPSPLSWMPAAVLLLAAAALAIMDRRAPSLRTAERPGVASVVRMGPDGSPLHWSLAPRYAGSVLDASPAAGQTAQVVPVRGSESWGRRSKSLVITAVVVAAAVVIPLSLWPQDSVAASSDPALPAAGAESDQQEPPTGGTDTAVAASTGEAELTTTTSPPTSSTTSTTTLARIGPDDPSDPGSSVWYSDIRFGLTMAVPADWGEVPASTLADYDPTAYHLASFAAGDGLMHMDSYLNGIDIRVIAGSQTEDPPEELLRQTLEKAVTDGPWVYDYFQVIEPIYETQIGDVTGLAVTYRITWNKRVMVKSLRGCIANHCLYLVVLQTDDADWETYEPVFDQILGTFTFGPQNGQS